MAGLWNKLKKSLPLKFSQNSEATPPQSPNKMSVESNSRSTVTRSSSSLSLFSRSFSIRSSKRSCAICLGNLKSGQGQAIFTAECSHSFHFSCIADSVKHGNQLCPICRSKWKDVPFQFPTIVGNVLHNDRGRAQVSPYQAGLENYHTQARRNHTPPPPSFFLQEPHSFNDDEPLPAISSDSTSSNSPTRHQSVTVKAFTELPAIIASETVSKFAILVGVRAPPLLDDSHHLVRAPIDLVTVLDASGSMSGSKLSLLKRAVKFVIQNLGPSDRLSIVVFSSSARRIFPLRRMSDRGREDATLAVDSLSSNGGTNIVEGLKKGVRVLDERRERNPVSSIILLSDGKDTYNLRNVNHSQSQQSQTFTNSEQVSEFLKELPVSICPSNGAETRDEPRPPMIPVHTFGFGADHDSASMHAISDSSGGTFSFIESVCIVQDAFARCIGGLLSVVAQELRLNVRAVSPGVLIGSIPSGKYSNHISEQGRLGVIDIGDLYADEEKEFLVYLSVPAIETSLLDVMCSYIDTETKETVKVEGERVEIRRPKILSPGDAVVGLEVDRQRNRVSVAEGIAEAQAMAETGNLEGAQTVLTNRIFSLLSSASAKAGDCMCQWLEAELTEIRERMASVESYEHTGRAYVHSGLSSHSWQRATTRGASAIQSGVSSGEGGGNSSNSGVVGYNTPSMVSMVSKSQVLNFNSPEQLQHISKPKSVSLTTPNRT